MYFTRWYSTILQKKLHRPYVHLLFGARQTGKSTLLAALLPADTLRINLADPRERSRLLAHPDEFIQACQALAPRKRPHFVFVDEAQTVPAVFDAVQYLYDSNPARWRFVLCGSSARKLRRTGANLLPGRSILHRLFGLTLAERPRELEGAPMLGPLPLAWPSKEMAEQTFPDANLETRLAFGDLPGIAAAPRKDRSDLLKTYAFVHLQEEIQREAILKDWGAFVRFLQLAAAESGRIVNYAGISQESGVSQPTVKSYYQLLEDMFVGITIPAYTRSPRKNLLSSPKFLFFDLGVRNAAAGLDPSPQTVAGLSGELLEQWVGIELSKRLGYLGVGSLNHLRTRDGAEIDFILRISDRVYPIEVKWTSVPTLRDARHLLTFLEENPGCSTQGYIICRCDRPLRLHKKILALPWSSL